MYIVQKMCFDRYYYNIKLFPNFHRAMMGNDSFDTYPFWNQYAFYNFIQRPMNKETGERPTHEAFNRTIKSLMRRSFTGFLIHRALNEVVKGILIPKRICIEGIIAHHCPMKIGKELYIVIIPVKTHLLNNVHCSKDVF